MWSCVVLNPILHWATRSNWNQTYKDLQPLNYTLRLSRNLRICFLLLRKWLRTDEVTYLHWGHLPSVLWCRQYMIAHLTPLLCSVVGGPCGGSVVRMRGIQMTWIGITRLGLGGEKGCPNVPVFVCVCATKLVSRSPNRPQIGWTSNSVGRCPGIRCSVRTSYDVIGQRPRSQVMKTEKHIFFFALSQYPRVIKLS